MALVLSVNPSQWNNPDKFPCGPSQWVPWNPAVCDYQLHGLQVRGCIGAQPCTPIAWSLRISSG